MKFQGDITARHKRLLKKISLGKVCLIRFSTFSRIKFGDKQWDQAEPKIKLIVATVNHLPNVKMLLLLPTN